MFLINKMRKLLLLTIALLLHRSRQATDRLHQDLEPPLGVAAPANPSGNSNAVSGNKDDAFFNAARTGDLSVLVEHLSKGMPVSHRDLKGNTALIIAAGRGQTEVIKHLLQAGASPDEATSEGLFDSKSALSWSASQGRGAAAAMLIQAGANVLMPQPRGVFAGKTPLQWASSQGRTDVVNLLLSAGAEVDFASDTGSFRGKNSLMWCSSQGRLDTVAALLQHGSKVNAVDMDNVSALMWASGSEVADEGHKRGMFSAANKGHIDVVQLLLRYGAHPDLQDKDGISALMYAAFNGHVGAVRALMCAGADVTLKNRAGHTALQLALNSGHAEPAAAILAGPAILQLPLPQLMQVSTCGWLVAILRAPVSPSGQSGQQPDDPRSLVSTATSCQELTKNGLNHHLGDLLYIVQESSIEQVVQHLGLPTFAATVRATAELRHMHGLYRAQEEGAP